MKFLLAATALVAVVLMPGAGPAFAQSGKKATQAKCSYTGCIQRCVANRGRFCSDLCRRCS